MSKLWGEQMNKTYITVFGRDNLGYSDKFGWIVRGQEYTIDEADFTDQLFILTRPGNQKQIAEAE